MAILIGNSKYDKVRSKGNFWDNFCDLQEALTDITFTQHHIYNLGFQKNNIRILPNPTKEELAKEFQRNRAEMNDYWVKH